MSSWAVWLAVASCAALMVRYVNITYDDAFISFRYAENLARGHGLVFNLGERVEGFSNFLWTILLVPFVWLGVGNFELGLLVAAKILGALFALCTIVLMPSLARRVGGPGHAPFAAMLLSVQAPFALWAVGGLETSLVTLLECTALSLHLVERGFASEDSAHAGEARGFVPSSFVWCLAALTRPEPPIYFAVCLVDRACARFRAQPGGAWIGREARFLAWFVLPYLAFLGFRLGYYGELLPNTYYAKMHLSTRIWARGADYVQWGALVLGWHWLLGLALLGITLGRRWTPPVRLVTVLLLAHLAVTLREGGDWMPALRFFVPMLPLSALLVHAGLCGFAGVSERTLLPRGDVPSWIVDPRWVRGAWDFLGRARPQALLRGLRKVGPPILGLAALGFGAASGRAVNIAWYPSGYRGVWLDCFSHFQVARYINHSLEKDVLLAANEAGVIPYLTRLPFLDLGALVDKHLSRQPGAMHQKVDVDYVLARQPEYFVLHGNYDQSTRAFYSTRVYSWSLLKDARFRERYRFVRAFDDLGLFLRVPPVAAVRSDGSPQNASDTLK